MLRKLSTKLPFFLCLICACLYCLAEIVPVNALSHVCDQKRQWTRLLTGVLETANKYICRWLNCESREKYFTYHFISTSNGHSIELHSLPRSCTHSNRMKINEPFIPRENPEVADTPQMEAEDSRKSGQRLCEV